MINKENGKSWKQISVDIENHSDVQRRGIVWKRLHHLILHWAVCHLSHKNRTQLKFRLSPGDAAPIFQYTGNQYAPGYIHKLRVYQSLISVFSLF